MTKWTDFVKSYAKDNNMTYGCALSDSNCSSAYKKSKLNPKVMASIAGAMTMAIKKKAEPKPVEMEEPKSPKQEEFKQQFIRKELSSYVKPIEKIVEDEEENLDKQNANFVIDDIQKFYFIQKILNMIKTNKWKIKEDPINSLKRLVNVLSDTTDAIISILTKQVKKWIKIKNLTNVDSLVNNVIIDNNIRTTSRYAGLASRMNFQYPIVRGLNSSIDLANYKKLENFIIQEYIYSLDNIDINKEKALKLLKKNVGSSIWTALQYGSY